MKNFWTFYTNIDSLSNPFHVLGLSHFGFLLMTAGAILLIFQNYKNCDDAGKRKWEHILGWYLFIQEMFFYVWTWCGSRDFWDVLQLELCTFCLFVDFSTIFHKNKQVRFFGALMGFIGAPIALIYPATVADIYPAFSYRLITFYMSHGTYILFAFMLLHDKELLTKERLKKNMVIMTCTIIAIYFFNLAFGTQYMFIGTPPEIPIIRMVYDVVGQIAFLPVAIIVFTAYQMLAYFVVKKIQQAAYKEA